MTTPNAAAPISDAQSAMASGIAIADLVASLPSSLVSVAQRGAGSGPRITNLSEDSRTIRPGGLFIARRGIKTTGTEHLPAAIASGAVAVLTEPGVALPMAVTAAGLVHLTSPDVPLAAAHLAERFYGNPSSILTLIATTGTNGKTTTSFLIQQLLKLKGVGCGLMGTVSIDDGASVVPASLTTAPAIEISAALSRMVANGCAAASFEASSHALAQRRTAGLRIRAGVFTNLTHDHLDYHGTMEAYADAKAILFEMLPAGSDDSATGGVAVVNADDPVSARMLRDCKARVIRCSADEESSHHEGSDWRAIVLSIGLQFMLVRIWPPGSAPVDVRLPLIGEHNVMNAIQAAAVASACFPSQLPPTEAIGLLAKLAAPPGRLEPVTTPQSPSAIIVDYAHTDDALVRVLVTLRDALLSTVPDGGHASAGRLICIAGCGGDRDATKRPKMARAASTLADLAVLTSDNPRSEDPESILDQMMAGVPAERQEATVRISDRAEAIGYAVGRLRPGDILLIAGKGHEDYQIVRDPHAGPGSKATIKLPFDDRRVAAIAAHQRGLSVETRLLPAVPAFALPSIG